MKKKDKILSPERIHEIFEQNGYFANEEIIYDTFNAICMFLDEEESPGQDIYAICLDGPPGAGKTEFAHAYTKLLGELYDDVVMVSYQCDATTGKTELFEDINVVGAVTRDEKKVNIPGYLVKALQLVKQGKRVILFIDEYDKAREETDSFFYQLLQSGVINTNQHGDISLEDEYKNNLQVIFCRNDFREKLSGPLTRRLRMLSLDYITPELFYTIATDKLLKRCKKPVNEELLNLVALMYEFAYSERNIYSRLPAASEMMIAISDANRLMTLANAPKHIIYKTITKNMFKDPSDLKTFEASLEKSDEEEVKALKEVLDDMKKNEQSEEEFDLKEEITNRIFENKYKEMLARAEDLENLIQEYKQTFKDLEEKYSQEKEEEIKKIKLENGKLVAHREIPNVVNVFEDETAYIKRGKSVFDQMNGDITEVGVMHFANLAHHDFYEFLINKASELDIQIFENGIVLNTFGNEKLVLVNDYDENDQLRYRFFSSSSIIPIDFLINIENLISVALWVYNKQTKVAGVIINDSTGMSCAQISINALVFDNKNNLLDDYNLAEEDVYNVKKQAFLTKDQNLHLVNSISFENTDLATYQKKLEEINARKKKALKNE